MQRLQIGGAASLAFIVGCAVATVASNATVPPAHSSPTPQWAYKCTEKPREGWGFKKTVANHEQTLNRLGAQGWEMIPLDFDKGIICFKRPA